MVIYVDECRPARAVGTRPAFLFCPEGFYLDFFRIKEMRRPFQPNILHSHNSYTFEFIRTAINQGEG